MLQLLSETQQTCRAMLRCTCHKAMVWHAMAVRTWHGLDGAYKSNSANAQHSTTLTDAPDSRYRHWGSG